MAEHMLGSPTLLITFPKTMVFGLKNTKQQLKLWGVWKTFSILRVLQPDNGFAFGNSLMYKLVKKWNGNCKVVYNRPKRRIKNKIVKIKHGSTDNRSSTCVKPWHGTQGYPIKMQTACTDSKCRCCKMNQYCNSYCHPIGSSRCRNLEFWSLGSASIALLKLEISWKLTNFDMQYLTISACDRHNLIVLFLVMVSTTLPSLMTINEENQSNVGTKIDITRNKKEISKYSEKEHITIKNSISRPGLITEPNFISEPKQTFPNRTFWFGSEKSSVRKSSVRFGKNESDFRKLSSS
jgi:hypothetical protein